MKRGGWGDEGGQIDPYQKKLPSESPALLGLIKFFLQTFPNLHNFKPCICHSGQIFPLIFV